MSHASLSPAEAERLEMLAEECAEVVQAVTKVLRHGYESRHPQALTANNRYDLGAEMLDLISVWREMDRCGDVKDHTNNLNCAKRWRKKTRYTHHQEVA